MAAKEGRNERTSTPGPLGTLGGGPGGFLGELLLILLAMHTYLYIYR